MKMTTHRFEEWIEFLQSNEDWYVILDKNNKVVELSQLAARLDVTAKSSFSGLHFDQLSNFLNFTLDDIRMGIGRTGIINYDSKAIGKFCMTWRKIEVEETFFVFLGEEICEKNKSHEDSADLKKNLHFKSHILSAIVESSKILSDSIDLGQALSQTFKVIGEVTEVDRVYYFEKNKYGPFYGHRVEWTRDNRSPQIRDNNLQNIDLNIHEAGVKQLLLGKPLNIRTRELPEGDMKALLQSRKILSMISLPVFLKNEFYGFVGFDNCTREKVWSKDEVNLLMTLSNNISQAVERFEIRERLEFKEKIISAIGFADKKLFHTDDVYKSLRESLDVIGEAAAVDRVCYFEKNQINSNYRQKLEWTKDNIVSHIDDPDLLDIDTKDYPEFFADLFQGKYYAVDTNKLEQGKLREILEKQSIISMIYLPVLVFNELHGYLGFDNCTKIRNWSYDEISVLEALATNVANAIERSENQRQLEYKASILTAIGQTNEQLFKSNNVLETLMASFSLVGEGTLVDRVYYFEKNRNSNRFSQKVEWVRGNVNPEINNPALQDMEAEMFPDFYNCVINRRPYEIRVAELSDGELKSLLASQGIISLLNIPIIVFDELYGFIGFDDCTHNRIWSQDELSILNSLAQNIANAIEKNQNNERLQHKASIMHVIGITNEKIFRSKDVFKTLHDSFKFIGKAVGVDRVYFYEKEVLTGSFEKKIEWTSDRIALALKSHKSIDMSFSQIDLIASTVLKGKPCVIYVSDLEDSVFKEYFVDKKILSCFYIPVVVFNQIYGFIGFDDCISHKQWSEDELSILASLANSVSSALEKDENEKRLEYKANMLSAIGKINERLNHTHEITEVLNESLALVGNTISADRVYYFEKNKSNDFFSQKLEWVRTGIRSEIDNPELQDMDLELYPLLKWRIYTGNPYVFKTKELPEGAFKDMLIYQHIISILNIPLTVNGRIYGFIGFDDCTFNRTWTQEELSVLASLANNLSNALEKYENQQTIITSERNFRQMNETIDDVFWLYNIEKQNVDYISPSCQKVLGKSQEFFYRAHDAWKSFVFQEDHARVIEAHKQIFEKGSYEVQYRVKVGDDTRWIFEKSFVIVNEDGTTTRNAGLSSDITEDVNQQRELERLLELTNQQNQRLTNFAHIVSHNIRSHSSNLTSLMDFLIGSPTQEESELYMSLMLKSTDKLAETIKNLNEIITIQNYANVQTTSLNLKSEIEKTIHALSAEIKKDNSKIYNDVPDDIQVSFVPAYMESILLNFLSNAIKYRSQDRDLKVQFSVVNTNCGWKLAITDNGLGIDLAKHGHKMFGMFKTFHKNPDARGMGLFITKSQLEAMKGKVEVVSEVDRGTTFYIQFNNEN